MIVVSAALVALALWSHPRERWRARIAGLSSSCGSTTGFPGTARSEARARVRIVGWGVLAVSGLGCVGLLLGGPQATALGVAVAAVYVLRRRRARKAARTDPLDLATGYDLFAAGLRAGLSLTSTLKVASSEFTGPGCHALRSVADRLVLGGDTVDAWEPALHQPETAELARAARRTARTGSPLATVAAELAERTRARAQEREHARAQRAGVWIAAPLGLCFLPAFLCLGVVPTVLGMLHRVSIG